MLRRDRRVGEVELEGVYAGLLAGLVLLFCEMLVAGVAGGGLVTPFVYAASIIMAERAFEAPLLVTVITGALIYAAALAIWGFLYGMVAAAERFRARRSRLLQALMGSLAGGLLWVVAYGVLARWFHPWLMGTMPFVQLVLLAGVFGTALGLVFARLDQRRVSLEPLRH
jgi:hypothetical protein